MYCVFFSKILHFAKDLHYFKINIEFISWIQSIQNSSDLRSNPIKFCRFDKDCSDIQTKSSTSCSSFIVHPSSSCFPWKIQMAGRAWNCWKMSFLRYTEGAVPGKAVKIKRKLTDKQKQNEEKQVRTFKKKWCENRPWLQYDDNVRTCTICIEYSGIGKSTSNLRGKNMFITGCSNMRVSTIADHECSRMHLLASESMASKTVSTEDKMNNSVAGKTLKSLQSADREKESSDNFDPLETFCKPYNKYQFSYCKNLAKPNCFGDIWEKLQTDHFVLLLVAAAIFQKDKKSPYQFYAEYSKEQLSQVWSNGSGSFKEDFWKK